MKSGDLIKITSTQPDWDTLEMWSNRFLNDDKGAIHLYLGETNTIGMFICESQQTLPPNEEFGWGSLDYKSYCVLWAGRAGWVTPSDVEEVE